MVLLGPLRQFTCAARPRLLTPSELTNGADKKQCNVSLGKEYIKSATGGLASFYNQLPLL